MAPSHEDLGREARPGPRGGDAPRSGRGSAGRVRVVAGRGRGGGRGRGRPRPSQARPSDKATTGGAAQDEEPLAKSSSNRDLLEDGRASMEPRSPTEPGSPSSFTTVLNRKSLDLIQRRAVVSEQAAAVAQSIARIASSPRGQETPVHAGRSFVGGGPSIPTHDTGKEDSSIEARLVRPLRPSALTEEEWRGTHHCGFLVGDEVTMRTTRVGDEDSAKVQSTFLIRSVDSTRRVADLAILHESTLTEPSSSVGQAEAVSPLEDEAETLYQGVKVSQLRLVGRRYLVCPASGTSILDSDAAPDVDEGASQGSPTVVIRVGAFVRVGSSNGAVVDAEVESLDPDSNSVHVMSVMNHDEGQSTVMKFVPLSKLYLFPAKGRGFQRVISEEMVAAMRRGSHRLDSPSATDGAESPLAASMQEEKRDAEQGAIIDSPPPPLDALHAEVPEAAKPDDEVLTEEAEEEEKNPDLEESSWPVVPTQSESSIGQRPRPPSYANDEDSPSPVPQGASGQMPVQSRASPSAPETSALRPAPPRRGAIRFSVTFTEATLGLELIKKGPDVRVAVQAIAPGSAGQCLGVRELDEVIEINGKTLAKALTQKHLKEKIRRSGRPVTLRFRRDLAKTPALGYQAEVQREVFGQGAEATGIRYFVRERAQDHTPQSPGSSGGTPSVPLKSKEMARLVVPSALGSQDVGDYQIQFDDIAIGVRVEPDDQRQTLYVSGVDAHSPAVTAGVAVGDEIVAVNGCVWAESEHWRRPTPASFRDLLARAGRPLLLRFRRHYKPSPQGNRAAWKAQRTDEEGGLGPLGGRLLTVTFEKRGALGMELSNNSLSWGIDEDPPLPDHFSDNTESDEFAKKGVVVAGIDAYSQGQLLGLRVGDRIHKINRQAPIALTLHHKHVAARLGGSGRPLRLVVERRVLPEDLAGPDEGTPDPLDGGRLRLPPASLQVQEEMEDGSWERTFVFNERALGLSVRSIQGGRLIIDGVDADSPAASVGVSVNSEIIAVNHVPWTSARTSVLDGSSDGGGDNGSRDNDPMMSPSRRKGSLFGFSGSWRRKAEGGGSGQDLVSRRSSGNGEGGSGLAPRRSSRKSIIDTGAKGYRSHAVFKAIAVQSARPLRLTVVVTPYASPFPTKDDQDRAAQEQAAVDARRRELELEDDVFEFFAHLGLSAYLSRLEERLGKFTSLTDVDAKLAQVDEESVREAGMSSGDWVRLFRALQYEVHGEQAGEDEVSSSRGREAVFPETQTPKTAVVESANEDPDLHVPRESAGWL
uniref:PDZ domain-containing protein n=1 Tax=Rhizochromulina marina TaxID=1034831 RepID=A0A7S2STN2_9STRA|mmetsp:Transcript_6415/g.18798  ORF Transcript_6415/g.18798 Transcript_6415/m.18798 type:complete len:1266 (+) Transcript_6415:204-4001(+)|eukprot:CAMPEP_0118981580 /NCGR_PEP_ID=MMETSP1173-20130426/30847_1 /TAXON_ID=1034831 /ORGANISM="Rhizochromulina marina cf, Strain CCMP1243" /LENGTH=1265 /DNA_ID=CAMNT_0006932009 /DNA_START=139 /DNA_END=3936 /DNA_ORIENTATION=-